MNGNQMMGNGILLSLLSLILCVSLVVAQSDVTGAETIKQADLEIKTVTISQPIDPTVNAEFDARIEQIREDAEAQVADMKTAMESSRGEDKEVYLRKWKV